MAPRSALQHAGMRASNLALVLGELADVGPLSRTQLAGRTGLTKSSVSGLVADLLEAGLVTESGPVSLEHEPNRGRPASSLEIDGQGAAGLGLEINVDYLAAVVVDLRGNPRYRHIVTKDNRGLSPDEVSAELAELAQAARRAATEQELTLAGTCVAVPGTVTRDGVVRAPNLQWHDVPLPALLTAALPPVPLELEVENEANLAALGELWYGGQAPADFVQVSGEIGIGGGIIEGGRLFRGASARAGELGHVVVDPDGPECTCGGHGCLERLAGQETIIAAAGATDRDDLLKRCANDDPRALAAVADAGRHLGVALASVVNLLDPEAIVLGGFFSALAPWLTTPVEESLHRHAPDASLRPTIVASGLGGDAAVRGAAGSVVRRVLADPASYLTATVDESGAA